MDNKISKLKILSVLIVLFFIMSSFAAVAQGSTIYNKNNNISMNSVSTVTPIF